MECPVCHNPVTSHQQFCPNCGVSLIQNEAAATTNVSETRTVTVTVPSWTQDRRVISKIGPGLALLGMLLPWVHIGSPISGHAVGFGWFRLGFWGWVVFIVTLIVAGGDMVPNWKLPKWWGTLQTAWAGIIFGIGLTVVVAISTLVHLAQNAASSLSGFLGSLANISEIGQYIGLSAGADVFLVGTIIWTAWQIFSPVRNTN